MGSSWWQLGGCQLSATLSQLQLQGGELPAQTGLVRSLPARALSPKATPSSLPDGRELRKTKRNIKRPDSVCSVELGSRVGEVPGRPVFKGRVEGNTLSSECRGRGWAHSSRA